MCVLYTDLNSNLGAISRGQQCDLLVVRAGALQAACHNTLRCHYGNLERKEKPHDDPLYRTNIDMQEQILIHTDSLVWAKMCVQHTGCSSLPSPVTMVMWWCPMAAMSVWWVGREMVVPSCVTMVMAVLSACRSSVDRPTCQNRTNQTEGQRTNRFL